MTVTRTRIASVHEVESLFAMRITNHAMIIRTEGIRLWRSEIGWQSF